MRIVFILWLIFASHAAFAIQFSSTKEQATLIELFTSQGCSSCPPAEKWLGDLKNNPDLWTKYVPVAWHVDYWDYIGWKDRYAQRKFVDRQRDYKSNGNIKSIYTPGLLKNGKEWRSWFWRKNLKKPSQTVGTLAVTYEDGNALVIYTPSDGNQYKKLNFNIALLESNLSDNINAGENHGKTLQHNFVIRQHKSLVSDKQTITIPFQFTAKDNQALAVWLDNPVSKEVVQATGTWLN